MHNILSLISIALLLLNGCSPMVNKYHVEIETITAPNVTITPTIYKIKALSKDTDTNSLAFQYHAHKLERLLQKEGYTHVNDSLKAKEILYFDYGIEKAFQTTKTYAQPNVGFGISIGNAYGHRYSPFWSEVEYNHYTTYRRENIYYNRYITLLAKEPSSGKELWRVDVSSIGESKNLKSIVPILIESAIPYIGKNSEKPIKIVVKDKSSKKE